MRAFAIIVGVVLVMSSVEAPAQSRECYDDTLKENVDRGEILAMQSGAVFATESIDRIDASLWMRFTNLLLCRESGDYWKIINTDESRSVRARRLR
jgi:hypothetical protein